MGGRILITGGRGRLARALVAMGGERVCALSRAELDVTDAAAVDAVVARLRPLAVINAAVVASVEAAEAAPGHARLVNAVAPGLLAEACARAGTPLVQVSTDYVFGAPTDRPWREHDPVSPINAYGRSKAEGEAAVLRSSAQACIARVAWLFGDGEDFIARLLRNPDQAAARVADDQIGSPTPIFLLAQRLLALVDRMLAADPDIPAILHLAGSPPVSRADWAATAFAAIERAGRRAPRLERVSMGAFPSTAARPKSSALDCTRAAQLFGGELDWRLAASDAKNFPAAASTI